jgi:endonuclease/exonuclease/phosphatase family metal-dependent hydrolase
MAKKKAQRKLSLFNKFILLLNFIFLLLILTSYISVYIDPGKYWVMPLFGLIFPYLLAINVFFVVYWAISRRYYFLISVVPILLGWFQIIKYVQMRSSSEPLESSGLFKLTSYNVKNLANDNINTYNPEIKKKIFHYLLEDHADILCLQEFFSSGPEPLLLLDSLSKILGLPYYRYIKYSEHSGGRFDAIVTFSRFPITNSGGIKGNEQNQYGLFTDIDFRGKTFRLFNIHLESFRFKRKDYEFFSEIEISKRNDDRLRVGSKEILAKMRAAFKIRALQVRNIAEILAASPYPAVICGDFNDTPMSYTYHIISRNFDDAFIKSGSGIGNTYTGKLPSYRIDYIFYNPVFISKGYRRTKVNYSDHYPITTYLMFKE